MRPRPTTPKLAVAVAIAVAVAVAVAALSSPATAQTTAVNTTLAYPVPAEGDVVTIYGDRLKDDPGAYSVVTSEEIAAVAAISTGRYSG